MSEPIWRSNLRDALLLDPLLVAHGNVKDVFSVHPDQVATLPAPLRFHPYLSFDQWLALELERLGYPIILLYDPVDGIVALRGEMAAAFQKLAASGPPPAVSEPTTSTPTSLPVTARPQLPRGTSSNSAGSQSWLHPLSVRQSPQDFFRTLYQNVFPRVNSPVAVITRFTDRYLSYTDRQNGEERELSLLIQKAAMAIQPAVGSAALASRIVMIFNSAGEIPLELHTQAPFTRSVLIPSPTLEEREAFFADCHALFDPGDPGDRFDPATDKGQLRFVANLSDGLKMQDLISLAALSQRDRLGLGTGQVKILLDRFRFGMRENAWLKVKPETLRNAKEILQQRVKGQDEVLDEVVPVLIRAKLGMSDGGDTQNSTKPRGAFFFVGPTGVGKTELSKAIAELIFGDEKALIRFDMSEYSEEHQQARLIGAPPGYVGFDQGGQLTNAIVERPFSVVLFDEIEKAHGRILDKFLQVLDDGRLTDGMGRTVYFSESIIVFTSNLGTSPAATNSLISAGGSAALRTASPANASEIYARLSNLSYDELCDHFRREVKEFFVNRLGRPEILNRIGEENILVFKFLTNIDTKNEIVEQQIQVLAKMLRERHHIELSCTRSFKRLLIEHPNGFARNGARGVRNLLNRLVLNPLAQRLFVQPHECEGKTCCVDYLIELDRIAETPFDRSALSYDWVNA